MSLRPDAFTLASSSFCFLVLLFFCFIFFAYCKQSILK
nr:MAG TPA_asm: hypothetical protein [Caudoviricetes sp.]